MPTTHSPAEKVELIEKIKTMPVLEALNEKELQDLLRISKIARYEPDEEVVGRKGYGGWIYYLLSGRVRIVKNGAELVTLQRTGDVFGEVGGLSSSELSATVYAVEPSTCLKIDVSSLEGLPHDNRQVFRYVIFKGFAEVLAKRLRITTEKYNQAKAEITRLRRRLEKLEGH